MNSARLTRRLLAVQALLAAYGATTGCKMAARETEEGGGEAQRAFLPDRREEPAYIVAFQKYINDNFEGADRQTETAFKNLPKEGIGMKGEPWSSSYFPFKKPFYGISHRWFNPEGAPQPPTSIYGMSPAQILELANSPVRLARLSAPEKLDLYWGQLDFTKSLSHIVKLHTAKFEEQAEKHRGGHCDGWSVASVYHKQPHAAVLSSEAKYGNKSIQIPFGASDFAALIMFAEQSYSLLKGPISTPKFAGVTCHKEGEWGGKDQGECGKYGLNAGTFHLILTNVVGNSKKPLFMDMNFSSTKMNVPIYKYRTKVLGTKNDKSKFGEVAPGTVQEVNLETTVWFAMSDGVEPSWNTAPLKKGSRTYKYRVELNNTFDKGGKIIGGSWDEGTVGFGASEAAPDTLWFRRKSTFPTDLEKRIFKVYEAGWAAPAAPEPR